MSDSKTPRWWETVGVLATVVGAVVGGLAFYYSREARTADLETSIRISEHTRARLAAEEQARADAEERARIEAKAKVDSAERARVEAKARADAEERERIEAKARADAEERERVEAKAKTDAEERERVEAEEQARINVKAKAEAEERARNDAQARAATVFLGAMMGQPHEKPLPPESEPERDASHALPSECRNGWDGANNHCFDSPAYQRVRRQEQKRERNINKTRDPTVP